MKTDRILRVTPKRAEQRHKNHQGANANGQKHLENI